MGQIVCFFGFNCSSDTTRTIPVQVQRKITIGNETKQQISEGLRGQTSPLNNFKEKVLPIEIPSAPEGTNSKFPLCA